MCHSGDPKKQGSAPQRVHGQWKQAENNDITLRTLVTPWEKSAKCYTGLAPHKVLCRCYLFLLTMAL